MLNVTKSPTFGLGGLNETERTAQSVAELAGGGPAVTVKATQLDTTLGATDTSFATALYVPAVGKSVPGNVALNTPPLMVIGPWSSIAGCVQSGVL